MSSNPTTAASQGASEAYQAYQAASAIGITNAIIYYDMEAYGTGTSKAPNCQPGSTLLSEAKASESAFAAAWTQTLHSYGFSAGFYGSLYNTSDWVSTVPSATPDAVWIGHYNDIDNTSSSEFSPWPANARVHQYCNSGDSGSASCAGYNTPSSSFMAATGNNW